MNPNMKLSTNFRLWEFTRSQTARRQGIDNTPNEAQIGNGRLLCKHLLEPVRRRARQMVGGEGVLNVSSGYRSPRLNTAVGGSRTSAHKDFLAADVEFTLLTPEQLATLVYDMRDRLPYLDQCILEYPPNGWVHLGIKVTPESARGQFLIKERGKRYLPWQPA